MWFGNLLCLFCCQSSFDVILCLRVAWDWELPFVWGACLGWAAVLRVMSYMGMTVVCQVCICRLRSSICIQASAWPQSPAFSLLFHSLSTHLRRLWAVSPGGKNLTPLNSFLSCKTGLVMLALPTSLGCDTHLARLWKRKHVTHTEAVIMNHFGIWGGGWHFHLKLTDGKIEGRGGPPGLDGTQILFP